MNVGEVCGFVQVLVLGGTATEADVFTDGFREQEWLLHHHAELRAHPLTIQIAQLMAIEFDRARCVIVKPQQQVHDGGFPRARGPKDCECFAWIHRKGNAIDGGAVLGVAENKIADLDFSLGG